MGPWHHITTVDGPFLHLRLRPSDPSAKLGMWLGLCRADGRCSTSYEEYGRTTTVNLAANNVPIGNVVSVAVLNNSSLSTGYTLEVEADDDTQPDPGNPSLCVPSLISPSEDAVVDNGRSDRLDPLVWDFDWSDCPGATAYDLFVGADAASIPVIDATVSESSHRHADCGFVLNRSLLGWTWRVRALTNGQWGSWSAERLFRVEPLGTDPQSRCP